MTNQNWDVNECLKDMEGLERAGMLLIGELDKYIVQRDIGKGQNAHMMGIAVASIMITSYLTEIVLKSVYAQTEPNGEPRKSHELLVLFYDLDPSIQAEAQETLDMMKLREYSNWIEDNSNIEEILKIANSNFKDWRYSNNRVNGIPKSLIVVAKALKILLLKRLSDSPEN